LFCFSSSRHSELWFEIRLQPDIATVQDLDEGRDVRERKMREILSVDFNECYIEVRVDIDYFRVELFPFRKNRQERLFPPRARCAFVAMTPVSVTKNPVPDLSALFK
jgi:hypothetical protein